MKRAYQNDTHDKKIESVNQSFFFDFKYIFKYRSIEWLYNLGSP
jgi:hypothetical protein